MKNSVNTENPSMFPIDKVPGFKESFDNLVEKNSKQEDENEKSFIIIRKDTLTAVLNQAMAFIKSKGIRSRLAFGHSILRKGEPTNKEIEEQNRAVFDFFISKVSSPVNLSKKEVEDIGKDYGVSESDLRNFFDKEFNPLEKVYENVTSREIDDYVEDYVHRKLISDKHYASGYLGIMDRVPTSLSSEELFEKYKGEESITPVEEPQGELKEEPESK